MNKMFTSIFFLKNGNLNACFNLNQASFMHNINRPKEAKKSQFFGNKASGAGTEGVLLKSCF